MVATAGNVSVCDELRPTVASNEGKSAHHRVGLASERGIVSEINAGKADGQGIQIIEFEPIIAFKRRREPFVNPQICH